MFEAKTIEPSESKFRFTAIQCRVCGAVVGVVEPLSISSYVESMDEKLDKIMKKIGLY